MLGWRMVDGGWWMGTAQKPSKLVAREWAGTDAVGWGGLVVLGVRRCGTVELERVVGWLGREE